MEKKVPLPIREQSYDNFFLDSLLAFEAQIKSIMPRKRLDPKNKFVYRLVNDSALATLTRSNMNAKGKFPFATTKINSIVPNTEGYNPRELKAKGIPLRIPSSSTDDVTHLILHPQPVTVSMGVSFIALEEADALYFAQRWIDSIQNNYLNYELVVFEDYIFKIKVRGDSSISFPELDGEDETGKMFNLETNGVEIDTYIMTTDKIPAIKRFRISGYGVNSDNSLADDKFIDDTYEKEDFEEDD